MKSIILFGIVTVMLLANQRCNPALAEQWGAPAEICEETPVKTNVPAIIYLYSSSMPSESIIAHLHELTILRAYWPDLLSAQIARGMDGNGIRTILEAARDEAHLHPGILHGLSLRIDPRFFKDIGSVPALVYATCESDITHNRCTPLFFAKGDGDLGVFFTRAAKHDSSLLPVAKLFTEARLD